MFYKLIGVAWLILTGVEITCMLDGQPASWALTLIPTVILSIIAFCVED